MSADPGLKKNYSGTFAGGQGPVMGQSVSTETENKGTYGGEGGGRNVKTVNTGGVDVREGKEEGRFDLHSKSYAGPENWKPEDKGVWNPSDIQHK